MTVAEEEVTRCLRHPRVVTAVRCSKCNDPICVRCMIQTPVGARCKECAAVGRHAALVGPVMLARAFPAGLVASLVAWYVVSYVPAVRYFLGILVGAAVGEVMSRAARRRPGRRLEVAAVVAVVGGLLATELVRYGGDRTLFFVALANSQAFLISLLIPAVIASFVAVVKLR